MTLKRLVENIEDVDEAARPFYVEVEGGDGYRLDAEPDDGGELKRALQKAKSEKAAALAAKGETQEALDAVLTKLDGADLDDVLAAAKKGSGGKGAGGSNADEVKTAVDSAVKQVEAKLKKEIADRDAIIASKDTVIDKTLVQNEAMRAIAAAGGRHKFLIHDVTRAIKSSIVDGVITHKVIGPDGEVRISTAPGSSADMTPDELLAEMKASDDWADAFPSEQPSGGGASNNNGSGGAGAFGSVTSKADLDTKSASEYIEKNGREAYLNLPEGPAA